MRRKKISTSPRSTILIVTVTEAEALYFSQMRKDSRFSNMTVVWEETYKDFEDLIRRVSRRKKAGHFTKAWLLFGLKDIGLSIPELKEALPYAKQKKISLAWNNPSLPLWFLLHLTVPRGFVSDPKIIEGALERQLPGFSFDASYLLGDGMYLHLKLYPLKAKAALNAGAYNGEVEKQLGLPACNIVPMLNDITEVCGLADLTHNQKMLGMKKG